MGRSGIKTQVKVEQVNFVFATKEMAELNYDNLKSLDNHEVYYLEQSGNKLVLTKYQ